MKNLRQLCGALVFTLALTVPTFADGQIDTPFAPPPPSQAQTATTDGDIQTPLTGQAETASSETTVTGSATAEAALSLLQSVLSLF
jgi:hypothetical protein